MASSTVNEVGLDAHIAVIKRWGWLLPSVSDAAFLIPIVAFFSCTTGIKWLLGDSDTGWHIRTGEWILKNRRVPSTDLFSFTKNGQTWFAWEWLSDLAMGWLHSHGGLTAIVFASFVILCTTSLVVYRTAAAESGHRLVSLLLTWLAMGAATVHWLARPHLVTPLMAGLFCCVLNRVERGFNPTILAALPALTILWVNLHGGFFLGIVLAVTYGAAAAGEQLLHIGQQDRWGRARLYGLTAASCVFATLLNPYGYCLHMHVIQYLGSPFYLQYISEFRPVDFQWQSASYFETLLVLAVGAALWHLGKGRLVHVLLPLSWAHLALLSARHVPIFAVVTLPSIAIAIGEWAGFAQDRWQNPVAAAARAVAEVENDLGSIASNIGARAALVPALGMIVMGLLLSHPGRMSRLRAEFDPTQFPVQAASVVEHEPGSPTRLFCSWQWGGYLIYRAWPAIKVFNDGRTDFYGPAFVKEGLRAWQAAPEWGDILARYGVNGALLPVDSALASVLRERRDWKLVYQDQVAVLFQRSEDVR